MAKPFFDSNVLLYLLSNDARKADRTEQLLGRGGVISVQVLNEFTSVARRKAKLEWTEIRETLTAIRAACEVIPLTVAIHDEAVMIAERYGFTIYDSLILAAAESASSRVLYSEDLQDGQKIGSVVVTNPFNPGFLVPDF